MYIVEVKITLPWLLYTTMISTFITIITTTLFWNQIIIIIVGNQHHHRHRHCPHLNYHHRYHRRHMWWFAPPLSYLQTNKKKTWRKNTQPTRQHSTGNIRDVIIIMQLVCMTVWPSSHVLPRSFRRFLSKILHLKDRVLLWSVIHCERNCREAIEKSWLDSDF